MQGLSVFLVLGILAEWSCNAVFLNHRPFPTYSLENMPTTQFTCREKILGGYYADPDTQCQMFHICVKVAGIGVQDFRFLCPNGTAFDQDHQICADWEDVDCDATTLYYSSDNFDLYRIGSGFESKAHRYGEDEETFALQRAETGDARINREPQTQTVNQKKDYQKPQPRRNYNNNNNQDREIFKASSSSNFFNNRNNGKETDEDYDDNVNVNQNRDYEQKRKVIRKQYRRPVAQNNDQASIQPQQQSSTNNRNGNNRQTVPAIQENAEVQITRRPQKPTGFVNSFSGSSYIPTTSRPSTTTLNNDQYTTASNNNNFRRGHRQRINNIGHSAPSTQNSNPPSPTYTVSTPAPFRQSSAANNQKTSGQYYTTSTENYPASRSTIAVVNYNQNYDVPKSVKSTENYPSNNPKYSNPTTPLATLQYNTAFDKKSTSPKKVDAKPTTFSPNAKPFSFPTNPNTQQNTQTVSFPTTFAPRTQQAYTEIAQQTNSFSTQNGQQTNSYHQQNTQQTTSYNTQKAHSSNDFSQQNPSTFGQQFSSPSTTQRSTTFTQYTPTVPKLSSTTPVSRSNRFDETQYDDGSYDSKFDSNGGEDEFLKTAHSQNIASSRNEFAKIQKQQPISTTQKPYQAPKTHQTTSYASKQTENYPKSTQFSSTRSSQVTQRPVESKPQEPVAQPVAKKVKNVSYDYAYYDSLGPEPDYQIDTEIKKSNSKN